MTKTRWKIRVLFSDRVLALFVLVFGTAVGIAYLVTWTGVIGPRYGLNTTWLVPAVMVACGQGWLHTDHEQVPGLTEFLEQKTLEFVPDHLPAELPARHHTFVECHRYLNWAVGITWRLCGISWHALKVLLAVLFGVTAAIVYGLFRLGMNRFLSTAGAALFVLSPGVLSMLPHLRDFSKAPFILGTIFILGYLVKRPVKIALFLALAGLLGLIEGIGLGFRQDLLICVPASVFVLAFGAQLEARAVVRWRLAGVAVLLVCFGIPAWPILRVMRAQGGAESSHYLLQGLFTDCEDTLGLGRASYERLYSNNDNFVYAAVNTYDRRVRGGTDPMNFTSASSGPAGRALFLEFVKTFPADMITRGYAAVLWTLGNGMAHLDPGIETNPFLRRSLALVTPLDAHLKRYRLGYALAAVLILSCHSLRLAWLAFFLFLYFSSYSSLAFQYRHSFHLSFIPVWMLGFAIDRAVYAGRRLARPAARQEIKRVLASPRQWWAAPTRRMLLFLAGAAILILAPLGVARAYQCRQVDKMLDTYAQATLEPVATTPEALQDWVLFRPADRLPSFSSALEELPWERASEIPGEYLIAEVASRAVLRPIWVRYGTEQYANDFSHVLNIGPTDADEHATTKYFFPVYQAAVPLTPSTGEAPLDTYALPWRRSSFAGVALLREHADEFKGLYRVSNVRDFPLFLNLSLPTDPAVFRRYQKLGNAAQRFADSAARHEAKGNLEAAVDALRQAYALDPASRELRARLAGLLAACGRIHQEEGGYDKAAEMYREAATLDPESATPYIDLDGLYVWRNDSAGRIAEWRNMVRSHPHTARCHYRLGMALEAAEDLEGAVEAYREAHALDPADMGPLADLGRTLIRLGDAQGAVRVLREGLRENPEASYIRHHLVEALYESHDYEAAWQEVEQCRAAGLALPPDLLERLARDSAREQ